MFRVISTSRLTTFFDSSPNAVPLMLLVKNLSEGKMFIVVYAVKSNRDALMVEQIVVRGITLVIVAGQECAES